MKIALVSPYSWTTPGGVNVHIAGLAKELRARGHEVRIIAPADGDVEAGVVSVGGTIGVPFNGSVARVAYGPRVAARVRVALRRAAPDIVHVHEPFSLSASMIATRAAKVPVVATFHAAAPDSRVYRAARPVLQRMWRRFAVRIAVSQAARDTVEGVFGPGARIIPNAIDTKPYLTIPLPRGGGHRILYFGRLEQRKGPQVLLEALPAIARAVPDVHVVVAGDGPLRARLQEDAPTNVTFLPAFSDADRLALLSAADVVCLPALGGESFGLTLLEAMAAGRPVVASSIQGFSDVARGGEDAVLVSPGAAEEVATAIAGLLGDPERARALGDRARARATFFDWSRITDEIEEAYKEAASGDSR